MSDQPTPRLYVSSVEGALVTRYGTRTQIGAEILPGPKGGKQTIRWNTGVVVALSQDELVKYKREYRRAIDAGELVERTADDFRAYIARENEENERLAQEREAARVKVEQVDAAADATSSDDKAEG